jgi:hypothetical protein
LVVHLRQNGYEAWYDKTLKTEHPEFNTVSSVGVKMDKIIVVCTEKYKQRAENRGEDQEPTGVYEEFPKIDAEKEKEPRKVILFTFEHFTSDLKRKIVPEKWIKSNPWVISWQDGEKSKHNDLYARLNNESEVDVGEVAEKQKSVVREMIQPL